MNAELCNGLHRISQTAERILGMKMERDGMQNVQQEVVEHFVIKYLNAF